MEYKKPLKLNLKKGALHKTAKVGKGKKIPVATLQRLSKSKNKLTAKRARFALNARKWKH